MAGGFCLPRTTAFTTSSPGHVPGPTFYLHSGADDRDRTGDLVLTKDVLCQLSYIGRRSLERETGIEPATNSLEGCDSTTELLPPSRLALVARLALRRVNPLPRHSLYPHPSAALPGMSLVVDRALALRRTTFGGLPTEARGSERRLVGRGGFEPP